MSHPGSRISGPAGAAGISSVAVPYRRYSIIPVEDAEAPCPDISAVHIGCHKGSIIRVDR
jgi:hypothetical protein